MSPQGVANRRHSTGGAGANGNRPNPALAKRPVAEGQGATVLPLTSLNWTTPQLGARLRERKAVVLCVPEQREGGVW